MVLSPFQNLRRVASWRETVFIQWVSFKNDQIWLLHCILQILRIVRPSYHQQMFFIFQCVFFSFIRRFSHLFGYFFPGSIQPLHLLCFPNVLLNSTLIPKHPANWFQQTALLISPVIVYEVYCIRIESIALPVYSFEKVCILFNWFTAQALVVLIWSFNLGFKVTFKKTMRISIKSWNSSGGGYWISHWLPKVRRWRRRVFPLLFSWNWILTRCSSFF